MKYIVRDENNNQDYVNSLEEAKQLLEEWFNESVSEGIEGRILGTIYKPILELQVVIDKKATKDYVKECQETDSEQEFEYMIESNGKWVKVK